MCPKPLYMNAGLMHMIICRQLSQRLGHNAIILVFAAWIHIKDAVPFFQHFVSRSKGYKVLGLPTLEPQIKIPTYVKYLDLKTSSK